MSDESGWDLLNPPLPDPAMTDADLAELVDRVRAAARVASRRNPRLADDVEGAALLLLAELIARHPSNVRAVKAGLTRRLPGVLAEVRLADGRARRWARTGGRSLGWVADRGDAA